MRTLATLCASLSLLTFAACNGGGSGDDTGDDILEPDAETGMPDAELEPDADNSCTTDTECVGHDAGDTLCMGNGVVSCSANGDCLDATTVACTGTDICVDDGTAACEALPPASGEDCAMALAITGDMTISGDDFVADFTDDVDFTGVGCNDGATGGVNAEAVFSVALTAGQTITVTQTGSLDAVLGIQETCGATEACESSTDDPEVVEYTAAAATTVFVYVGSYFAAPGTEDYSITFTVSECGDGALEANEGCDDDAVGGDGCSATCEVEFGYSCDGASPTVCTVFPTLGTYGAGGGTISHTVSTTVPEGISSFFTVTFTAPVRIGTPATVTATAGDPEWYAYTPLHPNFDNGLYYEEQGGLVENIGEGLERYFTPGTYVFEVFAFEELTGGFVLSIPIVAPAHTDLGTFTPAQTIAPVVGGALAAGASAYYKITFSAPVLVDGSLDSTTTGDMDFYAWADQDPAFIYADVGAESWTDEPLPAGTYYLRPNAYFEDPAVDGFTLNLSTTAAP